MFRMAGLVKKITLKSIRYVIYLLKPGLCQLIDRPGTSLAGTAQNQQGLIFIKPAGNHWHKIRVGSGMILGGVDIKLMGQKSHWHINPHGRVTNKGIFLRGPDINNDYRVRIFQPHGMGLFCRDIQIQNGLLASGNNCAGITIDL